MKAKAKGKRFSRYNKKSDKQQFLSRINLFLSYIWEKWEEVVEKSDYILTSCHIKGKEIWIVEKKGHPAAVVKGSFRKCMDFLVEKYITAYKIKK